MPAALPERLHRAVSILSRTGDPGAADAQAACAEVAARLVQLEEALRALLAGQPGAEARALGLLGKVSELDIQRTAKLLLDQHGGAGAWRRATERVTALQLAGDGQGVGVWLRVQRALLDMTGKRAV